MEKQGDDEESQLALGILLYMDRVYGSLLSDCICCFNTHQTIFHVISSSPLYIRLWSSTKYRTELRTLSCVLPRPLGFLWVELPVIERDLELCIAGRTMFVEVRNP